MAGERLVKRKDVVVVYGTGASKYLKTGQKYPVHKELAARLIEKGHASADPVVPVEEGGEGEKPKAGRGGKAKGGEKE